MKKKIKFNIIKVMKLMFKIIFSQLLLRSHLMIGFEDLCARPKLVLTWALGLRYY